MAKRKFQNPFLDFFRCYQVPPADKFNFVKSDEPKAPSGGQANSSTSSPINRTATHEGVSRAVTHQNQEDHFQKNTEGRYSQNLRSSAEVNVGKEFHMPSLENVAGAFVPKENLLHHIQSEVREMVKNLSLLQGSTNKYQPALKNIQNSSAPPQLSLQNSSSGLVHSKVEMGSQPLQPSLFSTVEGGASTQNVEGNFVKGSLDLMGAKKDSPSGTLVSLRSSSALQSLFTSLQALFPSIHIVPNHSVYFKQLLTNPSATQSEGVHWVQWANQLGVSPHLLYTLLPLLIHFQESSPQTKNFLQGLTLLFGIFAGFPQNGISQLSWPLLKGMVILENGSQINLGHSPLMDELGALFSTSRRRLRREAKKRISNLDKVSRKDSFLAEADPQENEEDVEALIDLWPKKESSNSSLSFYYM